jgi:hypothetical protein
LQVRSGAFPRGEHLKGNARGKGPALLANLRVGWKGLVGSTVHLIVEKLIKNLSLFVQSLKKYFRYEMNSIPGQKNGIRSLFLSIRFVSH